MTIRRYGNKYFSGIRYSFLGDRIGLEYEIDFDRSPSNSFSFQLGGDALFWISVTLFGRTLSFDINCREYYD